jgi:hypothetical protein
MDPVENRIADGYVHAFFGARSLKDLCIKLVNFFTILVIHVIFLIKSRQIYKSAYTLLKKLLK